MQITVYAEKTSEKGKTRGRTTPVRRNNYRAKSESWKTLLDNGNIEACTIITAVLVTVVSPRVYGVVVVNRAIVVSAGASARSIPRPRRCTGTTSAHRTVARDPGGRGRSPLPLARPHGLVHGYRGGGGGWRWAPARRPKSGSNRDLVRFAPPVPCVR